MAERIAAMRVKLVAALEARGGGGRQWSHITDQIGMFAFTGLSGEEVDRLLDEHGVRQLRHRFGPFFSLLFFAPSQRHTTSYAPCDMRY